MGWGQGHRPGCEHPESARFVVHSNRFSSVPNTSSPPIPDAHLGPFLARRVSLAWCFTRVHLMVLTAQKPINQPLRSDSHPLPFSVLEPHSLSRSCTQPQYCWSHIQKPKDRAGWVFVFSHFPKPVPSIGKIIFRLLKQRRMEVELQKQQNDRYAKCPEKWMANIRAMD